MNDDEKKRSLQVSPEGKKCFDVRRAVTAAAGTVRVSLMKLGKSVSFCTVLFFMVVFWYLFGWNIKSFAVDNGYSLTPWLVPLFYGSWTYGMYGTLMIILLGSEAPFLSADAVFSIPRAGRVPWCIGQMIFILLSNILLQILMFVVQILTLLPYVTFSAGWGAILTTAAEDPTVLYNYRGFGSVRPEIVQSMTPLEAMGKELALCILFGAVLGAVMFLVNGITRKQYGAVLIAGLLFLTDFLYRIDNLYDTNFCMKSPFNWLDLGYYVDGTYDFRVNVVILTAAFLALAAGNCVLTRQRVINTT